MNSKEKITHTHKHTEPKAFLFIVLSRRKRNYQSSNCTTRTRIFPVLSLLSLSVEKMNDELTVSHSIALLLPSQWDGTTTGVPSCKCLVDTIGRDRILSSPNTIPTTMSTQQPIINRITTTTTNNNASKSNRNKNKKTNDVGDFVAWTARNRSRHSLLEEDDIDDNILQFMTVSVVVQPTTLNEATIKSTTVTGTRHSSCRMNTIQPNNNNNNTKRSRSTNSDTATFWKAKMHVVRVSRASGYW